MRDTKYFVLGMTIMPVVVLGVAIAIASSVVTPNTFTAGTPAVAADVNANFAAHAAAINDNDARLDGMPFVVSQQDSDGVGHTETAAGQVEMNSVSITAPSAGFLLISGQVLINNEEVGATLYSLVLLVDAANPLAPSFAAGAGAGADGSLTEIITLHYTVTVPITAGVHTVSQTAGPIIGTADFFHNGEALSVTFIPTGTLTMQASP